MILPADRLYISEASVLLSESEVNLLKYMGNNIAPPQSELLILLLLHSAFPVSPGPSVKSTSSCRKLPLLDWQRSENSPN